jgi:aminoglycoside phosphotransferase (APT) family kinase protein
MQAEAVTATEPIQSLWSGYGQIVRMELRNSPAATSVIVKQIMPPGVGVTNARGWSGALSHARKLRSYEVEANWYRNWATRCNRYCRVPHCHAVESCGDGQLFILEDLDASGFPGRSRRLDDRQLYACLRWLASFHATFLNQSPTGLWETGTYWHLKTRPDEYAVMRGGPLKQAAAEIDRRLSECRFQTLVHGDAKIANFCFAESEQKVAAVDFQYVGGGCGMKDVAYFLGSCLTDHECETREGECLAVYFRELASRVDRATADALEQEWRQLFPWAWADFHRFLSGWCATHPKLTSYGRRMVDHVLS